MKFHKCIFLHILAYMGPGTICSMVNLPTVSVFTSVHTPLKLLVKTYLGSSLIYPETISYICWISVAACQLVPALSGIWAYTMPGIFFTKEGNADASEKILLLLKLQVCSPAHLENLV